MQWALMKNEDSLGENDIENRSLAYQNLIPNWLNKLQFLSFGSLITLPFLQWRKLCVALHDRALPFSHPAVRTLIQTLMYHVGPIIKMDSVYSLEWKLELENDEQIIETLKLEMSHFEQEVANSPREHLTIYLLAIIATNFYQSKKSFKEILNKIVDNVQKWIRDIEVRILEKYESYLACQAAPIFLANEFNKLLGQNPSNLNPYINVFQLNSSIFQSSFTYNKLARYCIFRM
jgi:hypothetical protein